jgi:hypothetical protein
LDSTTIGANSGHSTSARADTENEAAIIEVCAAAKDREHWEELMDQLNLSTDRILLVQIRNGLRHKRRGIRP